MHTEKITRLLFRDFFLYLSVAELGNQTAVPSPTYVPQACLRATGYQQYLIYSF